MARKKTEQKSWDSGNKRYTLEDVKKLRQAAGILDAVLAWDDTAEGMEFWSNVYERLDEIAATIETKIEAGEQREKL